MREIFIIGTIHDKNLMNIKELTEILEKIEPDQLLIEIEEEDLNHESFYYKPYPNEMVCAYYWAKDNKIKVNGFDYDICVLKNISKRKLDKVLININKKIKGFDWKEFNKKENRRFFHEDDEKSIDKKKWIKREKIMLTNIYNKMVKNGKIVILTGVGHLDFFEKNIKGAKFLLE